mgnify:CR=1 FL=1
MFEWIAGTTAGKFISTFFISMLPVVELRAGLPYGIALGLDYPLALTAAVIGNMIPVPFIIIFIQRVFIWLRRHWPKMDSFITKLEAKAHLKGEKVQKYGPIAASRSPALALGQARSSRRCLSSSPSPRSRASSSACSLQPG